MLDAFVEGRADDDVGVPVDLPMGGRLVDLVEGEVARPR